MEVVCDIEEVDVTGFDTDIGGEVGDLDVVRVGVIEEITVLEGTDVPVFKDDDAVVVTVGLMEEVAGGMLVLVDGTAVLIAMLVVVPSIIIGASSISVQPYTGVA